MYGWVYFTVGTSLTRNFCLTHTGSQRRAVQESQASASAGALPPVCRQPPFLRSRDLPLDRPHEQTNGPACTLTHPTRYVQPDNPSVPPSPSRTGPQDPRESNPSPTDFTIYSRENYHMLISSIQRLLSISFFSFFLSLYNVSICTFFLLVPRHFPSFFSLLTSLTALIAPSSLLLFLEQEVTTISHQPMLA